MPRRFLPAVVLCLAFATLSGTGREAAAQDAGAFIQEMGNQGIAVMGPSTPYPQRVARFQQLLAAYFDIPRIGYFVLGTYVRTTTPEQQQQFLRAFQDSIAQTYARKLGQYGGQPFHVTGVRPGAGETVVASQIMGPTGPVMIDWHVVSEGGQLKVTDVVIGSLSMLVQERELFSSLMQQSNNRFDIAIVALERAQ
jgi:phospholipid transport system substrate-binding protein